MPRIEQHRLVGLGFEQQSHVGACPGSCGVRRPHAAQPDLLHPVLQMTSPLHSRRSILAFSLWVLAAGAAAAQQAGDARKLVLDAARPAFQSDTGGAVEFVVRRLNVSGDWAFGDVKLQRPGGRAIDWSKTKYAADLAQGAFDPAGSFFLVHRVGGGWSLVEHATGPTDAPWFDWQTTHKLPASLFQR